MLILGYPGSGKTRILARSIVLPTGAVSLLDAPLILVLPPRTIEAALKSAGKE